MIYSKKDLKYYLTEDRKYYPKTSWIMRMLYPSEHDVIWNQIYNLRLLEYRQNTKRTFVDKLFYIYQRCKYVRILNRTQMRLHPNVFGPGLYIPHIGRISVSAQAVIGANCTIRPYTLIATNLGVNNSKFRKVIIGDNVEFSEGCKILCRKVGNNVIVGPNAVVLRNIPDNTTAYGNPSKFMSRDI